ncbi:MULTISPECIES: toxin glutamine deamidase domain-containing protein [unclassified Streptomyces]|uniref:toxin glutamine deamidase domain-containing protein n=1 Tax=unclassified Streptomyces TaxID=2593676 RepID=UPI00225381D0|nr:toxin glutamine deamidase domain-containing protein [Streptomyces sp. NBC_01264]MCX4784115.1 hypothetical protein [Streptomyces sp. NBC_01264]
MRRAKYAIDGSATARAYKKALDEGEVDYGGAAHQASQRAQASAQRAHQAADEGDHDAAARHALDAKNQMNHASRLAREHTERKATRAAYVKRTNKKIDEIVHAVNPHYDPAVQDYSHNCSHVAQTYELRRRGIEADPAPDTTHGRQVGEIGEAWGGEFTHCDSSKADIGRSDVERAFAEPGSRGIMAVWWKNGGGHAFTVENVGGKVRFVDGQPTPAVTDASHYFSLAKSCAFMRLDDKPTPSKSALSPFVRQ